MKILSAVCSGQYRCIQYTYFIIKQAENKTAAAAAVKYRVKARAFLPGSFWGDFAAGIGAGVQKNKYLNYQKTEHRFLSDFVDHILY